MGTTLENILWIPKGNEYELYKFHNILYCESKNQYTLFYIDEGTLPLKQVLSTKGIGEWEKELGEHGFCRIHSQILVNLAHIKKFINTKDGIVVLSHDINLTVSKTKKQKFMECSGIK